jgi:ribonucleotide reductase beta subunit family protein with ferritin-like domain
MKKNSEIDLFSGGKKEFYDPKYPWALVAIDESEARHWRWNQTNIENDFQDLTIKLTEQELHGIKEVLRLFTLYETEIGENYWQRIVATVFPHPEIKMMCSRFAYEEFGIHARAYAAINDVLGELDEEHMTSWKKDPNLVKRMKFIAAAAHIPKNYNALDILKTLSSFVLIEGAVLSSSFAFIKHFKSNGKNLISGMVEAINYSLQDEMSHYTVGSLLIRTLREQAALTPEEDKEFIAHVMMLVEKTIEHEDIITEGIFSKGRITGITQHQVTNFVNNQCVRLLDLMQVEHGMKELPTEIEKWYWTNISGIKMNDFFAGQSTAYSHNWIKGKF